MTFDILPAKSASTFKKPFDIINNNNHCHLLGKRAHNVQNKSNKKCKMAISTYRTRNLKWLLFVN